MPSPFRDENASLRAENERLRAGQQPAVRRGRVVVALGLVAADFGVAMMLRPWFNDGDDLKFWAALAMVGALPIVALWWAARR
jgi:hypothetical protein